MSGPVVLWSCVSHKIYFQSIGPLGRRMIVILPELCSLLPMTILVFVALLANMNLSKWEIEKKEKKKVGGETSCCYGFNKSIWADAFFLVNLSIWVKMPRKNNGLIDVLFSQSL